MKTLSTILIVVGAMIFVWGAIGFYSNRPAPIKYEKEIAILIQTTINVPDISPGDVEHGLFKDVLTVYGDGRVVFGPGVTQDEASIAFWKRVEEIRKNMRAAP